MGIEKNLLSSRGALQTVAIFMVLLVVNIPFVVGFQLNLHSVTVSGQDDVPGYVRLQDTLNIQANVTVDAQTLSQDVEPRISIGSNNIPFDNCIKTTPTEVLCDYSRPFTWNNNVRHDYTVNLLTGPITERITSSAYIDNLDPEISINSISQEGGVVRAEVSLRDYAFAPEGTLCSGLHELTGLVEANGATGTLSRVTLDGSCEDTVTIDVFIPSTLSNDALVTLTVYDGFDQTDVATATITLDQSPPLVSSIALVDERDVPLAYIGTNAVNGRVRFLVEDDGVLLGSSVTLNGENYGVSCVLEENIGTATYRCLSSPLLISQESLFSGTLSVTDGGGNQITQPLQFSIGIDSTAPIFDSVSGGMVTNGTTYVGLNTPFSISFIESEAGIYHDDITLVANGQSVTATHCELGGTTTRCDFGVFPFDHDTVISVSSASGADRAGNPFSAEFAEETFRLDALPPSAIVEEYYADVSGQRVYNIVPLGSELRGRIQFDETLSITGTVNASAIGGGFTDLSCEGQNVCVFSLRVGNEPIYEAITITAIDSAGNTVVLSPLIAVAEFIDGIAEPYIIQTQQTPEVFDRSIGRLINQRGYAQVTFQPLGVFTRSISFDECVTNEGANSGYNDVAYFRTISEAQTGDYSALNRKILFELRTESLDVDTLDLTCSYLIAYSRDDAFGTVSQDTVSFNVSFSLGNTVDGLAESYEAKLAEAIDEAENGLVAKIADLDKFVEIARTLCTVWGTIKGLISSLGSLMALLGVTEEAVKGIPFVGQALAAQISASTNAVCETKEPAQLATDSFGPIVNKFCNFVTCKFSLTSWLLSDDRGNWGSLGDESHATFLQPLGNLDALDDFDDEIFDPNEQVSADAGVFAGVWDTAVRTSAGQTEDSLVMSALNLCIPGIIKNMQEYNQIQCRYALCLRDEVPQGVPIEACDAEKSYASCKYVYGEVFNLINLVIPFDYFMNLIKQILSDPISLIGGLWGGYCWALCKWDWVPGANWAHQACSLGKSVADLGRIIGIISSFLEGDALDLNGAEDACDVLEQG